MNINRERKSEITDIVRERIPGSNRIIARFLLVFGLAGLIIWALFQFGALDSKGDIVKYAMLIISNVFIIISVICLLMHGRGTAFQYIFLFLLAVFWLELEFMSGYKTKLVLPILIIVSMRYYSRKYTYFTYFVCILILFVSVWCNAYFYAETGLIDINTVSLNGNYNISFDGLIVDSIVALKPSSSQLFLNGVILTFLPNTVYLTAITALALVFLRKNLINILLTEDVIKQEANQRFELANLKTKVMLSQVKPHFVYNALSSIALLCKKDPDRAKELVLDFSDYLRNNLDTLNDEQFRVCPFETELAHVRSYLNIECARFGKKLKVEYDIEEIGFSVPVLSIQPIVENAVKHGICEKVEGGTVRISSRKTEDGYVVIISDDGVGFDITEVENDGKVHIGIANIKKRIGLVGGRFEIESKPGVGTSATVFIKGTEELK